MSCFQLFGYNLVTESAATMTASSNDAFFPVENIKHDHTTKVYRSLPGVNSASVVFDLKTIEDVDSILLTGNSVYGFGFGSVSIEANGTNEWSSPAFTTSLTVDQEFNIAIKTFSTQTYRFWRLTFSGSGDYVEVSKVYIGKVTNLETNGVSFGWTYENKDRSIVKTNRYGQRFVDIINDQATIKAAYRTLNKDELEVLVDFYEYHNIYRPFWMVVDMSETIVNDKERFSGYFFLEKKPTIINPKFGYYDLQVSFVEGL